MDSPELKPCPFCGGEARSRDFGRGQVSVGCLNMDCGASSMLSLSGEEAITAWNTRAGCQQERAMLVEALTNAAVQLRRVQMFPEDEPSDSTAALIKLIDAALAKAGEKP